jgi:MFS family permease
MGYRCNTPWSCAELFGLLDLANGYVDNQPSDGPADTVWVLIIALGIAESGLFPGVVFYLSMWYKRNEQHYRVALFFSAASLAGAFGGILAWVSGLR